ncbi:MAG: hypothetical protein LBI34_01460 [Puniceicoccales bacterium]|jgi:hypothetical protein|nr:hypothetical protein [Puniceicoccales bacterium]
MKLMGKMIALGTLIFATLSASAMDFGTEMKLNSESVSNGAISGKEKVTLGLKVGNDLWGGKFHAGLGMRFRARGGGSGKTSPNIGYSRALCEWLYLDGGYTSHFYSHVSGDAKHHTNELSFAAGFGPESSLLTTLTYNFEERDFCAEASLNGRYNLSSIGVGDVTLFGNATIGCDRCERPDGIKNFYTGGFSGDKKAVVFFGLEGGVMYQFNDNVEMSVSAHLAGNGAAKGNWNNLPGGHQTALWWSSGVKTSF